ncbi:MAG: GNAT family N-acetyltransferase [Bacteroidales bacterium]|nr:GNAT family N-acetyltransferase [Bacteroidales bacterium]
MIELQNADNFIKNFETIYRKRIVRIPYTTKEGLRKTLLMCKCGKRWLALPYLSVAILENKITDRKTAPFKLFESEDGNIISTSKEEWEIRDTTGHSQYIYSDKILPTLNLDFKENIWDLFPSDVKRKIRKAIKNGVEVEYGNSKKFLNAFYRAYTLRMKEIGIMPYGKNILFRKMKTGKYFVFIARKDKKVIGGGTLNLLSEDIFTNEFFSTLSEFNNLYTSYALHYAMICFAKEKGAKTYSFGRSTRNTSVHAYKKHWKAEEHNLYWSYSKKR